MFTLQDVKLEKNTVEGVCVIYLESLARIIYENLLAAVKANVQNCQILTEYDKFLSQQLSLYKQQVGDLLRETFSHSAEVFKDADITQLNSWIQQIKLISEVDGNI